MYKQSKPRKVSYVQYDGYGCGPLGKLPPKYTDEEWDYNNLLKFRITDNQQRIAEKLVAESKRVADETKDTTHTWQREVEHHIQERTSEIKFLIDELNKQKKTALIEENLLANYAKRLQSALNSLKEKSMCITQKCCIYREGRIGVDLVSDEVDRQLDRELKVIKGCFITLENSLKETCEQLRKLRAAIYLLDEDLGHKDKSLMIDQNNLTLRQTQEAVRNRKQLSINKCVYSIKQWEKRTYQNIQDNSKELNSAKQLRGYTDTLLKQVIEDLQSQTNQTNDAFEMRIKEMRHVKNLLEQKHSEVEHHISDVKRNVKVLKAELADREESLQLCLVRLSNRGLRQGLELTCDAVQNALGSEMRVLKENIQRLKKKIEENDAILRHLLHVKVMQEEEINIKANSIKIDEVDCMTLRRALRYQEF